MRRKLLYELYDKLTPEEKRLFVQLTIEDRDHKEIMDALQEISRKEEKNHHSFTSDLIANISGNAIFDGVVYAISKLIKKT